MYGVTNQKIYILNILKKKYNSKFLLQNLRLGVTITHSLEPISIGSVFGRDEIFAAFEFSRSRGALNCKQNASKALLRDRVA